MNGSSNSHIVSKCKCYCVTEFTIGTSFRSLLTTDYVIIQSKIAPQAPRHVRVWYRDFGLCCQLCLGLSSKLSPQAGRLATEGGTLNGFKHTSHHPIQLLLGCVRVVTSSVCCSVIMCCKCMLNQGQQYPSFYGVRSSSPTSVERWSWTSATCPLLQMLYEFPPNLSGLVVSLSCQGPSWFPPTVPVVVASSSVILIPSFEVCF